LLALAAAGDRPVRFTCWMTARDTGGLELATGGDGHAYFWRVAGGTLDAAEPLWGAADPAQRLLCGAAVGDRVVTGTRGGHLYVWKDRCCAKAVRAHERGLEAIHAAGPNGMAGFATGGADGFIKLWTARCVHVRTYDLTEAPAPPLRPAIVAVHIGLARGSVAYSPVYARAHENGKTKIRYPQAHSRTDSRRRGLRSRSGIGRGNAHRRGTLHWRGLGPRHESG
jgi:hypothetical protein